jgi:hypothetical protein
LSPESTLPRIRQELDSGRAQARSQALHTLSKIGDRSTWAWITRDVLRDPDEDVARTAWRVAVALAPEDEQRRRHLVDDLITQFGRGGHDVQLSLSRALVALGDVVEPALQRAAAAPDPAVAAHARSTALLLQDPEVGFAAALHEAERVVALGRERVAATSATGPAGPAATDEASAAPESRKAAPTAGDVEALVADR